MEPFSKICIEESSLPKSQYDIAIEKILRWIMLSDESTNSVKLNPDYKTILCNKQSSVIDYVKTLNGWHDVVDIDYYVARLSKISKERQQYIKCLLDVNDAHYKMLYFYVKDPPISSYFIAIIGKRNTRLESCLTDVKMTNSVVDKLKEYVVQLEENNNKANTNITKSIKTQEETLKADMVKTHDTIMTNTTAMINKKHEEQKNFVVERAKEIEQKLDTTLNKVVTDVDKTNKTTTHHLTELEKALNTTNVTLENKTNAITTSFNEKMDQSTKQLQTTIEITRADIEKSNNEKFAKVEQSFAEVKTDVTNKLVNMNTYMEDRDKQYIKEFETNKKHLNDTMAANKDAVLKVVNDNDVKLIAQHNELKKYIDGKLTEMETTRMAVTDALSNKIIEVDTKLVGLIEGNQKTLLGSIGEMKDNYNKIIKDINDLHNKHLQNIKLDLEDVTKRLFIDGKDIVRM